jgi:NADPH:quinone reductase-like Zn-dependent oxidoreductase
MKAVVFTEYGPPDRLQVREAPKPTPKDDEVLVRTHASSVNSWDWEFQSGTSVINRLLFGLLKPRSAKQILGADIAGTVEEVGSRVTRFQPGDEVFGDLWDRWGGFAEYARAPEGSLELKPVNSTMVEAAAIPQAGVLALQGILKAGQLQPGQKVLINGAGGGVGTYAVQLAKLNGTEVTGVDKAHKLEAVRSVGADHVIDYQKEDFTRIGQQYDLIVDTQLVRSVFDCKRALSPQGTYAMIGGALPRILQALVFGGWGSMKGGQKFCLVAEGPNKGLADLRELFEAGKVVPVVDRVFNLSEASEALRYFAEGRHKGKIVVATAS